MAVDIERVVTAAVDSFLQDGEDGARRAGRGRGGRGRLGTASAVAIGVGLGLAGQAAYRRVRAIDLENAASALEDRLKR
ncbi:MAG TPA: hypothetical protein VEW67_02005 [Thermoleophilaceae bacterium]|nr:hypothetical protein [Thermoleophilaceae bacterium]